MASSQLYGMLRLMLCYLALLASAIAAPVVIGTVGMRTLEVATTSSQLQLLSVPFLNSAVVMGRLDGVNAGESRVYAPSLAFASLDPARSYMLRIRGGSANGSWFTISPENGIWSDAPEVAVVTNDGVAGNLASITGNEAFSVHPLFTIAELFPEDGSVLPAGRVDVLASQIHMLEGNVYVKYWLSDGTITDAPGWYKADATELRRAGPDAILPGTSFFVAVPETVASAVVVRLFGEVIDDAIRIPVEPGFNLISAPYNMSQVDASNRPSFSLEDLGLESGGFTPGSSSASSDQLLIFDLATQRFSNGFWLDDATTPNVWRRISDGAPAGNIELEPGAGFVVSNRGLRYWWQQGN